jgi:hypothetical protein
VAHRKAPVAGSRKRASKKSRSNTPPVRAPRCARASLRSVGRVSSRESQPPIASSAASDCPDEPDLLTQAIRGLQQAGFQVLHTSAVTINFAGPPEAYRRAFHTEVTIGAEDTNLIGTEGTRFADILESVALDARAAGAVNDPAARDLPASGRLRMGCTSASRLTGRKG